MQCLRRFYVPELGYIVEGVGKVKTKYLTLTILFLVALALLASACGGSTPAPTPAPTNPPTTAPAVAPTAASTATQIPTAAATQTPASPIGGDGSAVIAALAKFQSATSFRLEGQAHVSPLFFGAPYNPAPGEDPQQVTLFTSKGEVQNPDVHFTLGGFLGSFVAVVTGFDEKSTSVELASVSGKKYVRGALPGGGDAKWYLLSDTQAASTSYDPKGPMQPISEVKYQTGDIAKTGTESLDNLTCDIYSANRDAFALAFPALTAGALLNTDKLDLSAVDNFEFKFWLCADGNLHQVRYAFGGHDKTKPDQKGTFEFVAHISDYGAAIAIQAPPDAAPLPGETPAAATPTVAPQSTAPATTGYNGEWAGKESDDNSISFTVEDDKISYASVNYFAQSGSCSLSGTVGKPIENTPITGNTFTFQVANSDGIQFTVTGTFSSSAEASGTLQIKGTSQTCGAVDAKATWKSSRGPTPAENSASPTEAPTAASEATSVDSLDVVNAFFSAVNDKNYDAALALVNDEVVFTIGSEAGVGKEQLRAVLERGITYTTFNFNVTGDIVGLAATGSDGKTYEKCSIILEQGKIEVLTLQ